MNTMVYLKVMARNRETVKVRTRQRQRFPYLTLYVLHLRSGGVVGACSVEAGEVGACPVSGEVGACSVFMFKSRLR